MVSGVDETVVPWGREGQFLDTKYPYVIHAEANAILHSPNSHLLRGGSAYTTLYPCNECAKMLASVGIKSVYYMENKYSHTDSAIAASRIFEWCGIATQQIELSSENIVNTIKSLGLP
jgi:dCMP deaminase